MILCAVLTLLSTNASSKTLVVYYSYTNYCREIVSTLTSQIEADVLEMPNVRHWNGATPWSDAECMTVTEIAPGEQHAVQLQKVTDEEFSSPITHENMIVRIAELWVYLQTNRIFKGFLFRHTILTCLPNLFGRFQLKSILGSTTL